MIFFFSFYISRTTYREDNNPQINFDSLIYLKAMEVLVNSLRLINNIQVLERTS